MARVRYEPGQLIVAGLLCAVYLGCALALGFILSSAFIAHGFAPMPLPSTSPTPDRVVQVGAADVDHMTSFAELQAIYRTNPGDLSAAIDELPVATRAELVFNNLHEAKHANRLTDERDLPGVYRREGVRWSHFANLLTFPQTTLIQHISPHLGSEAAGGSYVRSALLLLVWQATHETA